MAANPYLSRELKSLRDELAALQRPSPPASPSPSADRTVAADTKSPPAASQQENAEERLAREQLHDLAGEITRFFDDAGNNISAHPVESVAGAMIIGILIGRLLGRH